MINRVLIRLKVVQIVYAYYKNSGKSVKAAEDEMFFSLSKACDLYHYLLLLMPGIKHYAADRISFLGMKVRPTESDMNPNLKFVNNRFVAQLEKIEQLVKFAEKSKLNWVDQSDFLRRLLDKIEASEIYKEYMESGVDSYEEDKELWRKLYKAFVFDNEELDDLIEEQSLYWNDDKAIVDTFVIKTIKRFKATDEDELPLLDMFETEEELSFGKNLLQWSIEMSDDNKNLIAKSLQNWEADRVAYMDQIILLVALAEIRQCNEIALEISMNEYIELAKEYSSDKSHIFINGVLNRIVNDLRSENKLFKVVR